jgi:hypothetical protein
LQTDEEGRTATQAETRATDRVLREEVVLSVTEAGMMDCYKTRWCWAMLGLLVLPQVRISAGPAIHVLDLRPVNSLPAAECYDLCHAAVCIQGLANREAPRVFLDYHPRDEMWLERLREPGGLCEAWPVRSIRDFDELLRSFRQFVKGVVLYDPDPATGVISTSLVATTVAGSEGAIALRKDPARGSLYNRLVNDPNGPRLPVLLDLTGKFTGRGTIWQTTTPSTGSAKCDAYLWAKEKYIDTGRCDPTTLFYTLDLCGLRPGVRHEDTQLSNLDYAVSRRAFCFELSCWGDERPNDDANQPLGTDLETFKRVLDACNRRTAHARMIKLCGFTNWQYKYTDHAGGRHEPVETEWELAGFLSAYNVYTEADAPGPQYISNASFYTGLLPAIAGRHYVQNPPPTRDQLVARGLLSPDGKVPDGNYIMIALGDYDQASWVLYTLGASYDDPARGQVDCNWGIDPNAVDRASVAMDYFYRHKTDRDYFAAWDSGAGYVNPSRLRGDRRPSGYPPATAAWRDHCRRYYRMFDYSMTTWIISPGEPIKPEDIEIYFPFSPDGIGTQMAAQLRPGEHMLVNNVPVSERICIDSPQPGQLINYPSGVHFTWYRSICWTAGTVKRLQAEYARIARQNHRFLDAYSYYYLLRHHLGGNNNYRYTWESDRIPRVMRTGAVYPVTLTVRNDGWDTWSEAEAYRLADALVLSGMTPTTLDYDAGKPDRRRLPADARIEPGHSVTFSFEVKAPASAGRYDWCCDMVREGVTWFQQQGNIGFKKEILVAADEAGVDTDGDGLPDLREEQRGSLYWHPDDGPGAPSRQGAPVAH